MTSVLLVLVSFALMEPVIYLSHRFVFHGFGLRIHRSHHRPGRSGFEANDLYPLFFASLTIVMMAVGARASVHPLLLVGSGVTAYGAAYLFVHDVYIHRRVRLVNRRVAAFERLKGAHLLHHLYGGEPYGMLFPVVPRALKERAAADPRPAERQVAVL